MKRAELKNDIKELLDREFSCRLVENNEEDIIRALNCIYSHYGYNYLHQGLYDLDYFSEVLNNGRFVAAVAENKHNQVMGFGALDAHPWFPGLMEMGGLVANPLARGNGIGDMLDDYRIEIGRGRGIKGLFSTPVMPNPVSQKLLSRHGFIPTGMYFHAGGPASLGDSGDGIHPMDCGFSVYIYDKDTVHRIFAPEECKEFIGDVYDEVGLKYEFQEKTFKPDSCTEMFFNHEIKENLLEVHCTYQLGDQVTAYQNTTHSLGTILFKAQSKEEMIESVKYGYLLEGMESGMEDPKHWGIQCIIQRGREIKDGKLTGRIVSPVIMTGYVPELLGSISMCSKDRLVFGSGGCGKGHKEWVKVADGGPYLKTKARLG